MLEKEIEKLLVQKVKKLGGRAYKFVSPGNVGVPDRLVVLPGGKIGFAELKQKGKKPTQYQTLQIGRLMGLGCLVMVVDSEEKIDLFLQCLKGADSSATKVYSPRLPTLLH